VEIDERRWVIDCGVCVKGSGAERLPDLARLEDLAPPSAVLVTHAHLDHIGAPAIGETASHGAVVSELKTRSSVPELITQVDLAAGAGSP
jgi:glyoxylase-like metal-dependent hydrolase (beta-lactamase superfamily II)